MLPRSILTMRSEFSTAGSFGRESENAMLDALSAPSCVLLNSCFHFPSPDLPFLGLLVKLNETHPKHQRRCYPSEPAKQLKALKTLASQQKRNRRKIATLSNRNMQITKFAASSAEKSPENRKEIEEKSQHLWCAI